MNKQEKEVQAIAIKFVLKANSIFSVEHELAGILEELLVATDRDASWTGQALRSAWDSHGFDRPAARVVLGACHELGLPRKDAGRILNATKFCTKGRTSQLLPAFYGGKGDKAKPKGDKPKGKGGDPFAAIMAIINGKEVSFSKDQASQIAAALAAKVR